MKIAVLEHDEKSGIFELFCFDLNDLLVPYHDAGPTADIAVLIAEIDADPTGIFWG